MATTINPQAEIPGTGRPKLPSVDAAADEYETMRDKRIKATDKEVDAKDALQKVLLKNEAKLVDRDDDGNPGYVYEKDGEKKIAIIEKSTVNVKVKAFKEPKPEKPEKADKDNAE